MNKGLLVTTAVGLLLVGGLARAQSQSTTDQNTDQNDDMTWDGPGYYAEDFATRQSDGSQLLFKVGGPFASYDACEAYFQQNPQSPTKGYSDTYQCTYRASATNYATCFLTTACVQHAGLPDDCEELMVLRAFRDRELLGFEEGRFLVDHYYRIAPRIVERIRLSPDRDRVLRWVLAQVRETARAIGCGETDRAIARYAVMVLRLQRHFGVTV
ncbi:MAG: hypothetical protein KGL29_09140 [Alphaproteobacteria bacterium]|nr:hypothetical protein [Alphaproteobacteria bacterium]MDE2161518.1 hypothetical protein [Alphaproteobacteria bacterium]MDE2266050.1 hypothetical protein [Alphaproteobacteria bacterium]MDE2499924.1 hypothetical protein [Alphaproteobacteria bacterium]